jgi:class 3 adenylate cyclase/tetratricopeptide (TPR) repeat protein
VTAAKARQVTADPVGPSARALRSWNVDAHIPGDRRRALASGATIPDRTRGAVLFADISGFTPLTEALAREVGAHRGPEELSLVLESVYDAVLSELHRAGGVVMYFSGDAVTCWFDNDNGGVAIGCGLAMQQAMARVGKITTPGGTVVELGMKVAVTAGSARRFVLGDPDIQLIDVLGGSLLDRVADLEHLAERGEVLVDAHTLEALGSRVELAVVRESDHGSVGVVATLSGFAPAAKPPPPPPRLRRSVSRQWVLPPVYKRIATGRGEFLAELRPVTSMFVRFGGFDFDGDDAAPRLLDEFVTRVQRIVNGSGGSVLNLTIGDKGAYLYSVFGAPLAHEDDNRRACAAALAVLELEGATSASGLQVGISRGPLFSGMYGHRHRSTFTCLGDATNLAARLMSAAPVGQAYVTAEVADEVGTAFTFEHLQPLTVKGKADPVAVSRLTGQQGGLPQRARGAAHHFMGRDRELEQLLELGGRAGSGHLHVAALVAEAGLGKSTLAEQAARRLGERGMEVYSGAAASINAGSYLVWRDVWSALFGLTHDGDPVSELRDALAAVDAELLPRLPLLGAVLGLHLEDNDLTRGFDAKLRKSSLESLLLRYLSVRFAEQPFVLWLEDCHWIDSLSSDLLEAVVRGLPDLPLLVLLTYRAGSFAAPKSARTTSIELERLDPVACEQLLTLRLEELYGADASAPAELVRRLVERAGGNPFYLGELANYLASRRVDLTDPEAGSIELPVSLSTLVLARVDALTESPRRTLKVASVVGREFMADDVIGAYPTLGSRKRVTGYLGRLCAEDLVIQENATASEYAFKHAVIREVTYASMPFGMRARLHDNVGRWLEHTAPDGLDLLAHHFWFGTDDDKRREYLLRAGDAAQSRFANDAAVDYFRRLAPLVDDTERIDVLMKLGAVLGLSGEWTDSETVLGDAMDLADKLGEEVACARARIERADVIRKQGRFDEATAELVEAERRCEAAHDVPGQGRVLQLQGTIAAQQGDYPRARERYGRSLEIRTALGDLQNEGHVLNNLALVAEYEEDYERCRQLNERALQLRTSIGDRWGIGMSRNNLGHTVFLQGDFLSARAHLEEAVRVELEVGDPWMVAMARHTLGHVARALGDTAAARRHYGDALRTFALSGDKWSECPILEDVAVLVAPEDPRAALALVGAAEAIRETIGAARTPQQAKKLDEMFDGADSEPGLDRDRELARGRGLGADAAVELALSLCSVAGAAA